MPTSRNGLTLDVRRLRNLWDAWRVVRRSGLTSKSPETRAEVKAFDDNAESNLQSLYRRLLKRSFQFAPATGIAQKRKGKSPRPIVRAPIESRIVQRSILDRLQNLPGLQPLFLVPTSFGGIRCRGVQKALAAAYEAVTDGAQYYVRSDIQSFFTKIPKTTVLDRIGEVVSDDEFMALLNSAVQLELANMESLGANADLFPVHEIGVAQGCCLSPLMGNVLLADFDKDMNGRRVTCLRYVDDFIILGHSERQVRRAFKSAQQMLAQHNLRAYDPNENASKADAGPISKGFEFLGCHIRPGMIGPNRKSRRRLLESVQQVFDTSVHAMGEPRKMAQQRRSLVDSLNEVSNVVRGWGNQYSYCNDGDALRQLDSQIDELIHRYLADYRNAYFSLIEAGQQEDKRRLIGVHLLTDSKNEPIVKERGKASTRAR